MERFASIIFLSIREINTSMSLLKYFSRKKEKNRIKALPKIEQGAEKFRSKYPQYEMGRGSYWLP